MNLISAEQLSRIRSVDALCLPFGSESRVLRIQNGHCSYVEGHEISILDRLVDKLESGTAEELEAICKSFKINLKHQRKTIDKIRNSIHYHREAYGRGEYFDQQFGEVFFDQFKNILSIFRLLPSDISLGYNPLIDETFCEIWDEIETMSKDQKKLNFSFADCIPNNIGRVTWLEKLTIKELKAPTLPSAFGKLRNLKQLYLSFSFHYYKPHLKLISAPEIQAFPALTELTLRGAALYIVLHWILNCIKLKKLSLFDNCLKTLPTGIDSLVNLKSLDLTYNPLESLPQTFVNLTSLKSLIVRNCRHCFLPRKEEKLFNQMPNLKVTYV